MKKQNRKHQYHAYLLSPKWFTFRLPALEHYGNKCGRCGSTKSLHVHHHDYRNIFNETFSDVMVLCKVCHALVHKKTIKPRKPKGTSKNAKRKALFKKQQRSNNCLPKRGLGLPKKLFK